MHDDDEKFVAKFRTYLQWVAQGALDPPTAREEMLPAFSKFVEQSGIRGDDAKKVKDKMEKFAKGAEGRPH